MYALKEATIKALSDARGVCWHDMEIRHNNDGKPLIVLSGKALENLLKKATNYAIQATASDEKQYAVGYVIIDTLGSK